MIEPDYQQALDYLYSLVDFETRVELRSSINYDLRRMDELLAVFGKPHTRMPSVHIAGTKGKGSTAAMIASAMQHAGYRSGLYTSPHLVDLTERMCINGVPVPRAVLVDLVNEIKPVVTRLNQAARFGRLTTFEVLTALGFLHFARSGANFQVIETGLGGRLDATNVLKPEVCVITSIGLDHTAVLGNTIELIAREKAGIIKPGSTVISAPQKPEAEAVIRQASASVNAVYMENPVRVLTEGYAEDRQLFTIEGLRGLYSIRSPLLGRYQAPNIGCAVSTLEVLGEKGFNISRQHIVEGLENVKWPGRFHILCSRPLTITDGAHTPESITAFLDSLDAYLKARSLYYTGSVVVFGASSDKDVLNMVAPLISRFDTVILTRSDHPRAMPPEEIAGLIKQPEKPVILTETVSRAIDEAMSRVSSAGVIAITGSLFVTGDAVRYFSPEV